MSKEIICMNIINISICISINISISIRTNSSNVCIRKTTARLKSRVAPSGSHRVSEQLFRALGFRNSFVESFVRLHVKGNYKWGV